MKRIYIISNAHKDKDFAVTRAVIQLLSSYGAEVFMSVSDMMSELSGCKFSESIPDGAELIIVIGGDGSFIDASVFAIELDVPLLGVNLGKVGYLSEVEPNSLSVLGKLFEGDFNIVEKMLLETACTVGGKQKREVRLAVNDVVVSHASPFGISDFTVTARDGGIKYRADGVVISTPAGSTAYSLSVGGPVVSHTADAIIVTPIAPHSFFNRSIVFGESDVITVENTGDCLLNVSVDGRSVKTLSARDCCTVSASKKRLRVLTFKNNNMFSTLFGKMKLLEDIV